MPKPVLIIASLILALVLVYTFFQLPGGDNSEAHLPIGADWEFVSIDDVNFKIEIAETPIQKSQGLSGRESLADNEGLLFVYDEPGYYRFWMREMNFAIDIIWFDQNFDIVDITHNFKPETYPETVTSAFPAQYVLEIAAGLAEKHEFGYNSKVEIR